MRGPQLEEMSSIITSDLVNALSNKSQNYNYVSIRRTLLDYINHMCPGPIDLEDRPIITENEKEQHILKHKTINLEIINRMIEENMKSQPEQSFPVDVQAPSVHYESTTRELTEEQTDKILQLVHEYNSFDEGDQNKITYLLKFNDFSKDFKMYKHKKFVSFLSKEIRRANNKHIILECLFILHRLILTGKEDHSQSFLEFVKKESLPLLLRHLERGDERFEYSYFKADQIVSEFDIPKEEVCKTYWNRMVNIIRRVSKTGITDNKLWLCINRLNRCKIRREWRTWLIKRDKYYDIKSAVMKELSPASLL